VKVEEGGFSKGDGQEVCDHLTKSSEKWEEEDRDHFRSIEKELRESGGKNQGHIIEGIEENTRSIEKELRERGGVKSSSRGAPRPPRLILPIDLPRGTGPLRMPHSDGLTFCEGGLVSDDPDIWREPCMSEAGIPPRSIGEVNGQGAQGSIVSYEELIINAAKVARARSASVSPQSPRTLFPVPTKREAATQAQAQETSATDSDKSEPRLTEVLMKRFNGLRRKLQTVTQRIKELIRNRKWAEKAHNRRERRAVPQGKRKSGTSRSPPRMSLRKSQSLRAMGAHRLKRGPSPRPKTGHHRQV
jgi:hypothetical protein